jgi:hypothetical protein
MSIGWRMVLGAAAGAAFGWAMYRFVGCRTGACPLNSNPWVSMTLWAVVGFLFARFP